MKIVVVNNGLAGGGIERASTSLVNFWSKQVHELTVLALYPSKPFFSLEPNILFREPWFQYKGNKHLYTLRMMLWLRVQVRRTRPDLVLAFGESTNPYVLLSLKGMQVPVFVSDRMHPKARLPKLTFWLKKRLYPKAAGVIAQTQYAKEILSSYLQSANIIVIPNPVKVIEPLPVKKLKRIVCVGRLEEVKGHGFLIKAFAKLHCDDWELSIVGDGSLSEELRNLANNLGIADRVFFHGHLIDFRKELSEAEIYVLPSIKEGFPNALLEAMSVPLPCISTDFMGSENELLVDGENGIVVPVADVDALAKALKELVNDPTKRSYLATNAIKVREQYAFHKISKKYLEFFENAC